jgi:hypothetical protein
VELHPLGKLTDGKIALVDALFAHPSRSVHLQSFREPIVEEMLKHPYVLAQKWAATMSSPEYTHSADGSQRLADDWTVDDAQSILKPLSELANKANAGQRLYLLLEW